MFEYWSKALRTHKEKTGTVFSTFCQSLQPVEGTDKLELSPELADVLFTMQRGANAKFTRKEDAYCLMFAVLDSFSNYEKKRLAKKDNADATHMSTSYAKFLPSPTSSNIVELAEQFARSGLFKHRMTRKDIAHVAFYYNARFIYTNDTLEEANYKLKEDANRYFNFYKYEYVDASFMLSKAGNGAEEEKSSTCSPPIAAHCLCFVPSTDSYTHNSFRTRALAALSLSKAMFETTFQPDQRIIKRKPCNPPGTIGCFLQKMNAAK